MRFYDAEIRSIADEGMIVEGYVNVTGSDSRILGNGNERFIEVIEKGAFKNALKNAKNDIDFLAEHNNKLILASTRNESLTLKEDKKGLYMKAVIANTSWGKDYFELIKSGILRNMSFGFKTLDDDWSIGENNVYKRVVKELELYEVSVVREPAYLESSISSRDLLCGEVIPENIVKENEQMNEMKEMFTALVEGIRSFNDRLANLEQRHAEEVPAVEVTEEVKPVEAAEPAAELEAKDTEVEVEAEAAEEKPADEPEVIAADEPEAIVEEPVVENKEERKFDFDMNEIRKAFEILKG